MKIKYIEGRVFDLLMRYPEAKDDDNILLSYYLQTYKSNDLAHTDLTGLIVAEKIATLFKSIERARRKLQAKNPDLRGSRWFKRHEAQANFITYANE